MRRELPITAAVLGLRRSLDRQETTESRVAGTKQVQQTSPRQFPSGENLFHNLAVNIRQSKIASLRSERQLLMIDP